MKASRLELQGKEEKLSEGVSVLAEVRRRAGEEREQSSKAVQAQQAATQAAEHQLQTAQVTACLHITSAAAHQCRLKPYALHKPSMGQDTFRVRLISSHAAHHV